jgi:hypothetical protein
MTRSLYVMIKSEFRVDSVDLWKKSLSTEKLVEGYMNLQRVTNPCLIFRGKRVYEMVDQAHKRIVRFIIPRFFLQCNRTFSIYSQIWPFTVVYGLCVCRRGRQSKSPMTQENVSGTNVSFKVK